MFEHSGGGRRGWATDSKLVGTNYAVDNLCITSGVVFEQQFLEVIHKLFSTYTQTVIHSVIHKLDIENPVDKTGLGPDASGL